MALFGSKKKEAATVEKAPKAVKKAASKKEVKKTEVATVSAPAVSVIASEVIIRPHVTEKSGIASQGGVYTFIVAKSANKNVIADVVKAQYKVTPVSVNVINLPAKKVFVRGKKGTVSGIRKAVVTLKKGDKIDFV
jgi:large subunit ribosomal protein L23